MPRLGSAIASTILSVFSGVLFVGVDKAQAAVLHYNFQIENGVGGGFFEVNNSSLTRIGYEKLEVSYGELNTAFYVHGGYGPPWMLVEGLFEGRNVFFRYLYLETLIGAKAVFYQGDFLGLQDSRSGEGWYKGSTESVSWSFDLYPTNAGMLTSRFSGYKDTYIPNAPFYFPSGHGHYITQVNDALVSYTLVDTKPEPVPEPLTAGGTALALAGLSWLKQKKKRLFLTYYAKLTIKMPSKQASIFVIIEIPKAIRRTFY
jgi:hypothetical protein